MHEPLVDLIFFDAGGGHRASAIALKSVLERQYRSWQVRIVNLRDALEPIDFIRRFTGVRLEELYNGLLRYGLTIATGSTLPILHMLIRQTHSWQVSLLAQFWKAPRPDLVVSMIPHFNRAILDGLRVADMAADRTATPMATVMTDLADYPPHFWMEPQRQHLICGTQAAVRQARAMGHGPEKIRRTSGMIVRPEFYRAMDVDRMAERVRLGLMPERTTGLVMFGGYGSRAMLTIARRAAACGSKLQLIFLCGHNQKLRRRLAALELPYPCHIAGFTSDVAGYMRLADFFIGKPGPGSISEALVMGLPLMLERNASTMVQERFNTDWVARNHLGLVLNSFATIGETLPVMTDPVQLARLRAQVTKFQNRALFELPGILEEIIQAPPEAIGATFGAGAHSRALRRPTAQTIA
ncbi:MAG TPA: glycosyltransferase [Candidatus Binataceae bacterium]|nr:glycosyltransferase [Candidatus Binataceae bacterium]